MSNSTAESLRQHPQSRMIQNFLLATVLGTIDSAKTWRSQRLSHRICLHASATGSGLSSHGGLVHSRQIFYRQTQEEIRHPSWVGRFRTGNPYYALRVVQTLPQLKQINSVLSRQVACNHFNLLYTTAHIRTCAISRMSFG